MIQSEFASLGIGASLCRALAEIGFETPSPIQKQAIPALVAGEDLLGIAQTGTGKTAAFSLPILQHLTANNVKAASKRPKALILAPTRELAAQIQREIARFAEHTHIRHTCIFGGVNQKPQVRTLNRGVEIVVATPGRLLDLAQQNYIDLSEISHLVFDEADRLMDMGFIRDIRKIVKLLPRKRQSLLFSATMPKLVAELAADILHHPKRIDVSPKKVTVEQITQGKLLVDTPNKQATLQTLLHQPEVTRAIVFTRTKHAANRVAKKLDKAGIASEAIHGNKSQNARSKALQSFASGDVWVLVATDIAARGIDIDDVSHVINYELPHEPESYVHRIGRTARAGASGVAWSLVDSTEVSRLRAIERLTKVRLEALTIDLPVQLTQSGSGEIERPLQQGSENRNDQQPHKRRRRNRRRRAA